MKIYDAFLFNTENDLLEARLKVLWDYVEKFILLECPVTHAGNPKPLYFDQERFAWAKEKLVHLVGNDIKPTEGYGETSIEHAQRTYLIEQTKLLGDGIIMISDVDEIPSREAIGLLDKVPARFIQDHFLYNVDCRLKTKWTGSSAFSSDTDTDDIVMRRSAKFTELEGGWHLSYFMSPDDIKIKLSSFAHHGELDKSDYKNSLSQRMNEGKSFINGETGEKGAALPDYLIEVLA